jgi:hypothetical protein
MEAAMRATRAVRTSILGAALALVSFAAEAAQPVKALGRTFSQGECLQVNGVGNKGMLCVRRDPASTDRRLLYYFTFDGIWSHMNIRELQSQSELSKKAGNRTISIPRPMNRHSVHTIWVQACSRAALLGTSKCTFWTQLRIRL